MKLFCVDHSLNGIQFSSLSIVWSIVIAWVFYDWNDTVTMNATIDRSTKKKRFILGAKHLKWKGFTMSTVPFIPFKVSANPLSKRKAGISSVLLLVLCQRHSSMQRNHFETNEKTTTTNGWLFENSHPNSNHECITYQGAYSRCAVWTNEMGRQTDYAFRINNYAFIFSLLLPFFQCFVFVFRHKKY